MNKFWALIRNEITRNTHRIFIYIVYALMILGIFGIGILYKVFNNQTELPSRDFAAYSEAENDLKADYAALQQQTESLKETIENISDPGELMSYTNEYFYVRDDMLLHQLAIEYEVNLYGNNYLSNLLYEYRDLTIAQQNRDLENSPLTDNVYSKEKDISNIDLEYIRERGSAPYGTFYYLTDQEIIEKKEQIKHILRVRDYAEYINLQIEMVKQDQALDETQKEFAISDLQLELKLNPNGLSYYDGSSQIANWQYQRDESYFALKNGYDSNFGILSAKELAQHEKTLNAVSDYLEKSYDNPAMIKTDSFQTLNLVISYGLQLAIFIMIILGGSAISQEISTGSIKGLIIAPVKRYKIFFAKLINLMLLGIVSLMIVYLSTLAVSLLFFDAALYLPFLKVNFPTYLAGLVFGNLSGLFMTGFISLALSAVIRNTSIAVGVSMIIQYGLLSVYSILKLNTIFTHAVLAFLPMEYLNLSDYLIPQIPGLQNNTILGNLGMDKFIFETPVWFPFIYWLLLAAALIWTARDSFVKRDL